ncbi:MAG: hypothetical protein KKI13_03475, partial [Candidatus Omnitrophica bacterium]|nr:hypothetical protein [Candidatus Omnitrophota bacterium]MCG2705217.1 hypothetical protein [Candidatus Omnitrophota bacterium]
DGKYLNIKKEVNPVMLPKIKPRIFPKPEVFGSMSMIKMKKKLTSEMGLICCAINGIEKNSKNPKTCGIFFME